MPKSETSPLANPKSFIALATVHGAPPLQLLLLSDESCPPALTLSLSRATLIPAIGGRVQEASLPRDLMKQTVRIAGGINELFGTLDENLKLFESSLHVTTHLQRPRP